MRSVTLVEERPKLQGLFCPSHRQIRDVTGPPFFCRCSISSFLFSLEIRHSEESVEPTLPLKLLAFFLIEPSLVDRSYTQSLPNMDDYDEFGNYIGPLSDSELGSEDDYPQQPEQDAPPPLEEPAPLEGYDDDQDEQRLGNMEVDEDGNIVPQHALIRVDESISNAVVLHEDRQYYPSASEVYGEDVETMVQEEDAQALSVPIVEPVKIRRFAVQEEGLPETRFDRKFLSNLMNFPDMVRNVAVVGHLHHGKTSLFDTLIYETHKMEVDMDTHMRYTDAHLLERDRGISIKSAPLSLVMEGTKRKSYLLNLIDTPGHTNFQDEVAAACRLADGVVLVVDVVEGVMCNTVQIIRHCIRQQLPSSSCSTSSTASSSNSASRPTRHTTRSDTPCRKSTTASPRSTPTPRSSWVPNAAMSHSHPRRWATASRCAASPSCTPRPTAPASTSTLSLNACGQHLLQRGIAQLFAKGTGRREQEVFCALHPRTALQGLFGGAVVGYGHAQADVGEFGHPSEAGRVQGGCSAAAQDCPQPVLWSVAGVCRFGGGQRSFAEGGSDKAIGEELHRPSRGSDLRSHGDVRCRRTAHRPSNQAVPHHRRARVPRLWPCHVRHRAPRMRVKVLGEGFSQDDEEDMSLATISDVSINETRYVVPTDGIPAGNWVLLTGIDASLSKTGTVVDASLSTDDLHIFSPLQHLTQSVLKVSVEPLNPSELPKMLEGLRRINKSYPLAVTKVEESGEHVVMGTGELYLDCVLHDLRVLFSEIEIRVSDPVVRFCETVVETSAVKCYASTPNKRNKLTIICEPLEKGLAEDIESGVLDMKMPPKQLGKVLQEKYGWDLLASRSVWAFGPDERGANVLVDDTLPSEVDKKLLYTVKESIIQGFQWACREGPLADEPIRNVKFRILDADLSPEPIHRGGGQIIPTARRAAYAAFLLATPASWSRSTRSKFKPFLWYRGCLHHPSQTQRTRGEGHAETGIDTVHRPGVHPRHRRKRLRDGSTHRDPGPGDGVVDVQPLEYRTRNPTDAGVKLRPLEPAPPLGLAKDFVVKTRRRKGLPEGVGVASYLDADMTVALAQAGIEM